MRTRKLIYIILLPVIAAFLLTGCSKTGPTDNVKLIINYNKIKTTFGIRFVDANTGAQIGYADSASNNVQVTLTGPDAAKIVDVSGISKQQFTSAKGFLGLGLDPAYPASGSTSLNFTLIASCPGYVSNSLALTVRNEGNYSYIVKMVSIAHPPAGVSATTFDIFGVSGGIVPTTTVITTPVVSSTNTSAKMTIPANTLIKDAYGNPLNGNLHVTLVYFNNQDETSLGSFPGGLIANTNNGSSPNTVFASAGFIAAEISDDAGNLAKTFDNNTVQFDLEVPSQTYNPLTQAAAQSGDQIPLWSYNPSNGNWSQEGTQTLTMTGGKLTVSGNVSHLSYWNWDWFYGMVCPFGCTFNFSGANLSTGEIISLLAVVRNSQTNAFLFTSMINASVGMPYQLQNVPSSMPVNVSFYNTYGSTVQTTCPDLCSGIYNVNVDPLFGSSQANVVVHIEGYCPEQPSLVVRPSLVFWYRDVTNNGGWQQGYMVNGAATLYNAAGKTFSFGVYFDGQWQERQIIVANGGDINLTGINFTDNICSQFL